MGLALITPATELPVSLEEAMVACRVEDESTFDALLTLLLAGACDELGTWTGRPLGVATWRLTLDEFSDAIELPRAPVVAVSSVQYYDADGVQQTADPDSYALDLVSSPQWVVLNTDETWPTTLDAVNAVSVDFTAGYDAATIPAGLKGAVLGLVEHRFVNGVSAEMPAGVRNAASPFRRIMI